MFKLWEIKKKATIRPEKHHITVNVFVRKVGNYSLISASNTAATSRNKRMNDSSLEKWTNHFSFRYRLHSGGERMISVYCRTNRMWRMCGQHEMNESLAEMTRCSKPYQILVQIEEIVYEWHMIQTCIPTSTTVVGTCATLCTKALTKNDFFYSTICCHL